MVSKYLFTDYYLQGEIEQYLNGGEIKFNVKWVIKLPSPVKHRHIQCASEGDTLRRMPRHLGSIPDKARRLNLIVTKYEGFLSHKIRGSSFFKREEHYIL